MSLFNFLAFRSLLRVFSMFYATRLWTIYQKSGISRIKILDGKCGTLTLPLLCLRLREMPARKAIILFLWPFKWTLNQVWYTIVLIQFIPRHAVIQTCSYPIKYYLWQAPLKSVLLSDILIR